MEAQVMEVMVLKDVVVLVTVEVEVTGVQVEVALMVEEVMMIGLAQVVEEAMEAK